MSDADEGRENRDSYCKRGCVCGRGKDSSDVRSETSCIPQEHRATAARIILPAPAIRPATEY